MPNAFAAATPAQGHQQSNVPNLVGQLLGQGINQAGDALANFKQIRRQAKQDNQYYGKIAELSIKNQLDHGLISPEAAEEYGALIDQSSGAERKAIYDSLVGKAALSQYEQRMQTQGRQEQRAQEAHDVSIAGQQQAQSQSADQAQYAQSQRPRRKSRQA